ncbi:hypothetical protein ACWDBW_38630 [Streptomyces sp. NPDC001107]
MQNTGRIRKAALACSLAVAATAFATPAQAATLTPLSTHRGTSGCFNWSWADGNTTATIYYHNTCKSTKQLVVTWETGLIKTAITFKVPGNHKGHDKEDGTIVKVSGQS